MTQEWQPIEPLTERDRAIDVSGMAPLASAWRHARTRLEQSSEANLQAFHTRLIRRLSVETGILERLYDVDRGTTEQLVTHGFNADLIVREGSSLDSGALVEILHDHEAAAQLVMDWVGRSRRLTLGAVNELHQLLTRHQSTTTAQDQFGNRTEVPLLRGQFKQQPNNPRRADGVMHKYCPPVHVAAEMDNLLGWLADYDDMDPVLVAAWLHHRFAQIHPYRGIQRPAFGMGGPVRPTGRTLPHARA